jgi:hypothetical protein
MEVVACFIMYAVTGSSYTATIYGQYQNLVLGDENAGICIFGNVSGSSDFYALSIERIRL